MNKHAPLITNIKHMTLAALLSTIGLGVAGFANANDSRHSDYADVTTVTPVYKTVEKRIPQEHCWTETVRQERKPHNKSATGTLVGGVIGGVIGNEVGRGSDNKRIGAVVGSLLGMSIANDINHDRRYPPSHVSYRDVERCEVNHVVKTERILDGYDVNYRYRGRDYSTHMNTHPGTRIKVVVDVRPIAH